MEEKFMVSRQVPCAKCGGTGAGASKAPGKARGCHYCAGTGKVTITAWVTLDDMRDTDKTRFE